MQVSRSFPARARQRALAFYPFNSLARFVFFRVSITHIIHLWYYWSYSFRICVAHSLASTMPDISISAQSLLSSPKGIKSHTGILWKEVYVTLPVIIFDHLPEVHKSLLASVSPWRLSFEIKGSSLKWIPYIKSISHEIFCDAYFTRLRYSR
jgi:hypothetical protein